MINVCIPTLNAQDEFWKCVNSIQNSSIDCNIFVVDNGGYIDESSTKFMTVYKPTTNLGVAGSWNWFIDNVPDKRIICNDDIIFDQYAIEQLLYAYNENNIICPENLESHFSCFLLPQHIIEVVGNFDEWISPRYAYFEDNDYFYRMNLNGFSTTKAPRSYVQHKGSSTLKHFDKLRIREHHDKFRLARDHYKKKWGGEPGKEFFKTPFGIQP
jgi:GT2 family glycosyltransferase